MRAASGRPRTNWHAGRREQVVAVVDEGGQLYLHWRQEQLDVGHQHAARLSHPHNPLLEMVLQVTSL